MSRRNERSHDSRHYYDWIDAAAQDLLAAETLVGNSKLYDSCAFHCQQCVEKALKSYILFRTGNLVDGHNLTWLCKQAVKYDKKFTELLDESAALNHYYIETRYPSDFAADITEGRIHSVLKMAYETMHFIDDEIHADRRGD